MTIYIIGMGAVGSLFGAVLHSSGHKVVGLCRGVHYDTIKHHGLVYENLEGNHLTISIGDNFKVFTDFHDPKSNFPILSPHDWIFISSKAYSLETLVKEYKEILSQHGSVVLVQNGIGNEEMILKILPNIKIYRLLTTNGALLKSPGKVKHTGPGYTKIGFPECNPLPIDKKELETLVNCFSDSVLSADLENDIDLLLWEKIFVNIGINAIGAVNNVPNGGLVESDELKLLMGEAITESWKVARGLHIPVDSSPDRYIEFTYSVCEKTKPNRNSMLQDLDKGRETEIGFINGKIVEYGKNLDIKTPINLKLTQQIEELEKK